MITKSQLNENLLKAEYAVRGPIVQRALELEATGRKIIYCNIGNPQALRQRPLSYVRQFLCLLEYPELLQNSSMRAHFWTDIVNRVERFLAQHEPGTGAYTQSAGLLFIRQAVAEFIARRDGIAADPEKIILTDGASKGAQAALSALIRTPRDGFMIPIPQYPLYSASLTLLGGRQVRYYLDEARHWQLSEEALISSLDKAKREGTNPVGIVVINPGNPTGAVLSRDNIEMVLRFARSHELAVIADEVYQDNVYAEGAKFHSFAKVMQDLRDAETPLFSLHSVSKGFLGECGHRGGYMEMRNLPDDALREMAKLQSIGLCANVPGQVITYLMVDPPRPEDESYETYVRERRAILDGLKAKAEILWKGINAIPGMSLENPEGAMYAFVRFELPDEAGVNLDGMTTEQREAYAAKRDTAYCLDLLEECGICVVPGSGFGQAPGTMHFRTTFLPLSAEIDALVGSLHKFHVNYVRRR
jgi:aspartate/methionine/tyrosine aminotransferase